MIEDEGHKTRRIRRELRPKRRIRAGEGCAGRFGKRIRLLNFRENGAVLVQSRNLLPFPLAVKFGGLRAADKEELRASYGQVLRPL